MTRQTADPAGPLHVVLGAGGGVGSALVRALRREGRRVRAVGRTAGAGDGAGVEWLTADVATGDGARHACDGAAVVFQAAQPAYDRWPEEFPPMTACVIDAAAAAGAKLVMADNLYMYGPATGPLTEQTPRAATGRKGRARIRMEEQLLEAHRSGRARVAIGRLSDYYGPNGPHSTVAALVLEPAAHGKTMRWVGSTDEPRTLHHVDDAARGLIVLADDAAADGAVWHLPAAPAITGREFMGLVNTCLPAPVPARSIGTLAMRVGGLFSTEARETVECMYQWTSPFVSDHSRFEAAFGPLEVTPHALAVPATISWMRGRAR